MKHIFFLPCYLGMGYPVITPEPLNDMLQKPIFGHTWSLLTKVVTKIFSKSQDSNSKLPSIPWIENSKTTNIKNLEFELKKRTLPYCALHICTGISLSEALILGSTNPHYDKRLFIDLPVLHLKTTSSEHGENMLGT